MKLTKHFTLEEFSHSSTAKERASTTLCRSNSSLHSATSARESLNRSESR